ncbi:MAG: hypothetical protein JRE28_11840 [Deltaproteobacteria bacterium]|nr:hypothetical protein [Deltaproteobacteria bacterium]
MVLGKIPKKGKMSDLMGDAAGLLEKMLDDFNQALPIIKGLGFTVKGIKAEMELPPKVKARLTASVEATDAEKIQELIDKNSDKKFLVFVLKGLLAGTHIKEQLGDLNLKGVEAKIKLGAIPNVSVNFLE